MAVIDAHQHVWDPRVARYDWLTPALSPIDRPFGFDELRPSLQRAGVDATVLVQSADNDDDTDLMLATAAANPEVAAVVAYVPLDDADAAAARIAELKATPLFVGVRTLIHEQPDPDWLLRPEVADGLALLEENDLTFDLVAVLPRHLEHASTLAQRYPGLRIVIDHLAKPPIGRDDVEPWSTLIAEAAAHPRVFAKVSGLYSAVGSSADWTVDSVRPVLHRALDLFGAERLMYGGDWPISVLSGGYDRVWDGLSELIDELSLDESTRILGGTAEEFYRIDAARLAAAVTRNAQTSNL